MSVGEVSVELLWVGLDTSSWDDMLESFVAQRLFMKLKKLAGKFGEEGEGSFISYLGSVRMARVAAETFGCVDTLQRCHSVYRRAWLAGIRSSQGLSALEKDGAVIMAPVTNL